LQSGHHYEEDPPRWERFIQELGAIFPSIHLLRPEFDEQTDRYIRAKARNSCLTNAAKARN